MSTRVTPHCTKSSRPGGVTTKSVLHSARAQAASSPGTGSSTFLRRTNINEMHVSIAVKDRGGANFVGRSELTQPSHNPGKGTSSAAGTHAKMSPRAVHTSSTLSKPSRSEGENVVQRTQQLLRAAGRHVWKPNPLLAHRKAPATSASRGGQLVRCGQASEEACEEIDEEHWSSHSVNSQRALVLPRTIPRTYSDDDEEEEYLVHSPRTSRQSSHARETAHTESGKRSRDVSAVSSGARRTGAAAAAAAAGGELTKISSHPFLSRRIKPDPQPEREPVEPLFVCPGMFAGVSAVELSGSLFGEGAEPVRETVKPSNRQQEQISSVGRCYAHAARGLTAAATSALAVMKSSHPVTHQQHGQRSKSQQRARSTRGCARALWSLVGTFKSPLGGVVDVDRAQDCMRWNQRNPHGGFQLMRVPLHCIRDATVLSVMHEHENIRQREFTLVVRTTTRPSQVVFGFATQSEAAQFRQLLATR